MIDRLAYGALQTQPNPQLLLTLAVVCW